MTIRLVTDSTADLPPELAEKWNIKVVPLYVNFGQEEGDATPETGAIETLRDGVDIGPDEFYRRLVKSSVLPTTSQPTVQDFISVYQELTQKEDQVISVHISSVLSGTHNSAVQAKNSLGNSARVEVVDTTLASMGVGLAVLAGARAIESGANFDEVLKEIQEALSQLRIFFVVDTLEYLQKGGRIGRAQAFLGSLLSIKPILTMEGGEIQPLERVRTRGKALQRLSKIVEEMAPLSEACVIHNTTPEDVNYLKESLSHLLSQDKIVTARLGACLGVHVGPGLLGVAARSAS
ncbi:MAG: DegV family protein [Dehalococcoidia bacterium]